MAKGGEGEKLTQWPSLENGEEGQTHLDERRKVARRQAVPQHTLDVRPDDLEVDEKLEELREVDAREAEEVGLS